MSSGFEDKLAGRLFVRGGDCWDLGRTNSHTSARRGDGLGFIRIWATLPKRLVFWDGAPSPSDTYFFRGQTSIVTAVGV